MRTFRKESGLSLSELAKRAGLSKGYLSAIENEPPDGPRRPSADILLRVADVLGVRVADLLGEDDLVVPASLRTYADAEDLGQADVRMLAGIKFRGMQPQTVEAWRFVYTAIKLSTRPLTEE